MLSDYFIDAFIIIENIKYLKTNNVHYIFFMINE